MISLIAFWLIERKLYRGNTISHAFGWSEESIENLSFCLYKFNVNSLCSQASSKWFVISVNLILKDFVHCLQSLTSENCVTLHAADWRQIRTFLLYEEENTNQEEERIHWNWPVNAMNWHRIYKGKKKGFQSSLRPRQNCGKWYYLDIFRLLRV